MQKSAAILLDVWAAGFPEGMMPVVIECVGSWPDVSRLGELKDTDLQAQIDELDKIMPAWYSEEQKTVYRLSLERKGDWVISTVDLRKESAVGSL